MDARQMLDHTLSAEQSPLQMDQVRNLAREIMDAVHDPKMHPSIAMKAARAIADRKISAHELAELLDFICSHRNTIKSSGAYFVACLKRIFQRNDVPWRSP